MTPEGRVKELIKREIERYFPESYRFMPVQNGMGAPALDFFYCIRRCFVAIEAKAPGGEPTARQEQTIEAVARAAGYTFVIDGKESLQEAIDDLLQLPIPR